MMSSQGHFAWRCARGLLAALFAAIVIPGYALGSPLGVVWAGAQQPAPADQGSSIPPDQLDSLVAPIALYPDPLLAQTLAASTYPLELLQLQQWLARNPGLKDKALLDAVERQPWDPSIKAMAALPDVVKRLADDIQWTTDLGNAFLAQEADVMGAVQRMRVKAQATGNLQSSPQQTVETQVVESKQVIVIEQADPEVLYVPSYNPTIVWGAPVYPYPPIYYPPAGYYAGRALAFGAGVAMGSFWSGGWGWGANWGHNDININRYNSFNRYANVSGVRGNTWQHSAAHRGGAPYRDRATANRYGGAARGDSLASRQAGARQQIQRQGGNVRGAVGTGGVGSRAAGAGAGQRAAAGAVGSRAGGTGVSRGGTSGFGSRPDSSFGGRTGSADRVGGRDLSRGSGSGSRSAFSGGSDRFNGSSARASSSRGSSSMRSSRGGGFSGGGGGGRSRGGGRR